MNHLELLAVSRTEWVVFFKLFALRQFVQETVLLHSTNHPDFHPPHWKCLGSTGGIVRRFSFSGAAFWMRGMVTLTVRVLVVGSTLLIKMLKKKKREDSPMFSPHETCTHPPKKMVLVRFSVGFSWWSFTGFVWMTLRRRDALEFVDVCGLPTQSLLGQSNLDLLQKKNIFLSWMQIISWHVKRNNIIESCSLNYIYIYIVYFDFDLVNPK